MSEAKKRDVQSLPASKLTDAELLEMLTKRYEPSVIPPCRVCGGKLGIEAMGGGEATRYACRKARGKDGMDWEHYRASSYTDYRRGGDSDVIQLIKRFNRKAKNGMPPFGCRDRGSCGLPCLPALRLFARLTIVT